VLRGTCLDEHSDIYQGSEGNLQVSVLSERRPQVPRLVVSALLTTGSVAVVGYTRLNGGHKETSQARALAVFGWTTERVTERGRRERNQDGIHVSLWQVENNQDTGLV